MSAPCARVLRGGGVCTMEEGHRGRCSSVTFYCDGCGHRRRGYPSGHAPDEGGPDADPYGLTFCYLCVHVPDYLG